ncbi:hypothetical protein VKT23_006721 [Stygiomarasmius scandens]|uniref:Uncharacterized protein n=1 Tax=Marasmiellus scandens TaxID=2682957 RepID=A0ABR1JLN0_9AGAR
MDSASSCLMEDYLQDPGEGGLNLAGRLQLAQSLAGGEIATFGIASNQHKTFVGIGYWLLHHIRRWCESLELPPSRTFSERLCS